MSVKASYSWRSLFACFKREAVRETQPQRPSAALGSGSKPYASTSRGEDTWQQSQSSYHEGDSTCTGLSASKAAAAHKVENQEGPIDRNSGKRSSVHQCDSSASTSAGSEVLNIEWATALGSAMGPQRKSEDEPSQALVSSTQQMELKIVAEHNDMPSPATEPDVAAPVTNTVEGTELQPLVDTRTLDSCQLVVSEHSGLQAACLDLAPTYSDALPDQCPEARCPEDLYESNVSSATATTAQMLNQVLANMSNGSVMSGWRGPSEESASLCWAQNSCCTAYGDIASCASGSGPSGAPATPRPLAAGPPFVGATSSTSRFGIYSGLVAERKARLATSRLTMQVHDTLSSPQLPSAGISPRCTISKTTTNQGHAFTIVSTDSCSQLPSPMALNGMPTSGAPHFHGLPAITPSPLAYSSRSRPAQSHMAPSSPLVSCEDSSATAFVAALQQGACSPGRKSFPEDAARNTRRRPTASLSLDRRQWQQGSRMQQERSHGAPRSTLMEQRVYLQNCMLHPTTDMAVLPRAPAPTHLSTRVESLRHKLRTQAAELAMISEQHNSKVDGVGNGMAARPTLPLTAGRTLPTQRRFAVPTPLLTTQTMGLACPHLGDSTDDEQEEERSRAESTLSYLRMLSRSNTSFCTRMRRSHTAVSMEQKTAASMRLHLDATGSNGFKRSILGGMYVE